MLMSLQKKLFSEGLFMEVIKTLHKLILFKMVFIDCLNAKISGIFSFLEEVYNLHKSFYTFHSLLSFFSFSLHHVWLHSAFIFALD